MDNIVNFGRAVMSTNYDAAATSIVLSADQFAKLPQTAPYNLVWWNHTDYPSPEDDPNVEIIRVTTVNAGTNTLTVSRAQEGTAAVAHNISGKQYWLINSVTKAVMDAIQAGIDSKASASHTHALDSASITGNLNTLRLASPPYDTYGTPAVSAPLFDVLRADRLAFLPASQIIIEKSTDAGVTWVDAEVSDTNKALLFTGARPAINIPLLNGVRSTNCMLRITITPMRYNVPAGTAETDKYNYWNSSYVLSTERYTRLSDVWFWVTSFADHIQCVIQAAPGNNSTVWTTVRTAYLFGWTGGCYASLDTVFGGIVSQTSQSWNLRFIFRTCSATNTLNDADLAPNGTLGQTIYHIKAAGPNVWTYSNQLMYNDHLYAWDVDKNATFPAKVTATQLVSSVASGTAPLVVTSPTVVTNLNADTLDGNHASAFAAASHSHTESDITNLNTDLGNKLDKAGGTMSGDITLGENSAIALDPAGSADEKWSGITVTGTAGATLAVGDLCYLNSSWQWVLANASAASTSGSVVLGICLTAATSGNATRMLLMGTIRSAAFPASITGGAQLYVSATAGDMTTTQPSTTDYVIRVVGWALTTEPNTIFFCPSADYITHT